jgi:dipeptidyl aminopeptidase/acylaminoacyl peptidase
MRILPLVLVSLASSVVAAPLPPDMPSGADAARDLELAKVARPLLEAHTDRAAHFLRDGHSLVFISNRDGLPQIYVADGRPDAPARRLLNTTERIADVVPLPDGKTLLFRSDHGADENWSIFRVDLDGKHLTELTPGEKLNRDPLHVPEDAPTTVYYTARPMATQASTLWALALDGKQPRKVYSDDAKAVYLADVSRDGKRAIATRIISRTDNQLLLIDLSSGAAHTLYPTRGAVRIYDAAFTPDGARVIVASDGGGEEALVLSLDVKSGNELARYAETRPKTASLGTLRMSPTGDRIVVEEAAGERTNVRILDGKTLAPTAEVKLPLGCGVIDRFAADGNRLTLTWSTPTQPDDVFALDPHSGTITPLRHDPRPSLPKLPPLDISVTSLTARDGLRIPINVYRPVAAGRHPTIVSYHGGPSGTSTLCWSSMAAFFLLQGYAWAAPNVRGSSGFGRAYEMADNGRKRRDALGDVDATAEWAAAQPWADRQRLVVLGGSYGGYTTLMALTRKPELWRAGVDMFGPVDWKSALKATSGAIREVFRVEIGELGKDDAFLAEISPITHIDRIKRPLFVYAGANDPRVPRSESDQVVTAVRKHGVACEYMVKDDEGHSMARRTTQIEVYSRVARFLEKALGAPVASK